MLNNLFQGVLMNIILTSAIILGAALIGYVSYLVMGPDNKVEQSCEQVIETESGQKVDLSPEGPSGPSEPTTNQKL
jgi:hypothetical protein